MASLDLTTVQMGKALLYERWSFSTWFMLILFIKHFLPVYLTGIVELVTFLLASFSPSYSVETSGLHDFPLISPCISLNVLDQRSSSLSSPTHSVEYAATASLQPL